MWFINQPDVQSKGKSEKEEADKQNTQTLKRFVDDEMLEQLKKNVPWEVVFLLQGRLSSPCNTLEHEFNIFALKQIAPVRLKGQEGCYNSPSPIRSLIILLAIKHWSSGMVEKWQAGG